MDFLLKTKVIPSDDPKDIAKFLLHTEGLSKRNIGEYLGEGCVRICSVLANFLPSPVSLFL
jgi:brefeldin A-inhibited guanine nucleotide-exchange protein